MIAALTLIFTLLHVVFDIKLRDSTGQVKVHKIKEKKETRKMEKGQEMSALSSRM